MAAPTRENGGGRARTESAFSAQDESANLPAQAGAALTKGKTRKR
jgi:hypothetical protein